MSIFDLPPIPANAAGAQAAIFQGSAAYKASVNFNAGNADTSIPITLPTGFTRYRVNSVRLSGASASLSTATMGVFTAATGGGVAVVTAATAITVTSAAENTNNNTQQFTIANQNTISFNAATLFVRVATAQGSAATGTVTIEIEPLS